MSEVEVIKLLVNQRLTAVAEEIVGLFEKTFAEYQENVARLVEETQRQRRLLDSVQTPGAPSQPSESQKALAIKETPPKQQTLGGVSLNHEHVGAHYIKEEREDIWCSPQGEQFEGVKEFPFSYIPLKSESREEHEDNSPCSVKLLHGDVQQLQKCNEEVVSEEHEWRPALKEEPECSQSQVEQENLSRSQRETCIGLGENSVTELPFVKREADEEEARLAQLHENTESSDCQSTEHMEAESDGDGCGAAEPLNNAASETTSDSSDSETEDSDDDWKRTNTKKSYFKAMIGDSVVQSQPVQASEPSAVSEQKTSDSSETEDSDNDSNKSKSGSTSVTIKQALHASSSKVHTEKNSRSMRNHTRIQTAQMSVHDSQGVLHKANSGKRTSSTERLLSDSKKCKKSASPKAQNTKDTSFTCPSCNKSFQLKARLVLHMKMCRTKSPNVSGAYEPV